MQRWLKTLVSVINFSSIFGVRSGVFLWRVEEFLHFTLNILKKDGKFLFSNFFIYEYSSHCFRDYRGENFVV